MSLRIAREISICLAVVLLAGSARADAVMSLVWFSTSNPSPEATAGLGTDTLRAAPGDVVGVRVMLEAQGDPILWAVSVAFDFDLGDELELVSAEEFGLSPTVTCTPFPTCFFNTPTVTPYTPGVAGTVESTTSQTGFVFTFEASTIGAGVYPSFGPFKVGEIFFTVTENVEADGGDLQGGLFNPGYDGVFSGFGPPEPTTFLTASLDRVPHCQDGVDNDGDTRVDFGEDTGCASAAGETEVGDEDGDGVPDDQDNCSLVANPAQRDADGDLCGNLCDSDYNQDGIAGVPDFNMFRLAFESTLGDPEYNAAIDHNADGVIGIPDHNFFRQGALKPPGPSGLSTGALACP